MARPDRQLSACAVAGGESAAAGQRVNRFTDCQGPPGPADDLVVSLLREQKIIHHTNIEPVLPGLHLPLGACEISVAKPHAKRCW